MKFRLAPGLSLIVACCLALTACSSMPDAAHLALLQEAQAGSGSGQRAQPGERRRHAREFPAVLEAQYAGHRPVRRQRHRQRRRAPSGRDHLAGARRGARASGQRRADRDPGRRAQCAAGDHRRHAPIDLEFAPSVYTPKTAAIYISWGPMPAFAETAPVEAAPGFVSPTEVPKPATEQRPPSLRHRASRRSFSPRRRPAPDVHLQSELARASRPRRD